tara:strand:- start:8387 stop:9682 length:1296 start_codon:yes stop_codon:yes gene_type:complete
MEFYRSASWHTLYSNQKSVVDAIESGENLFMTGPGGVGKSYLIKYILNHKPDRLRMFVTALTGAAAVCIDGKTLHNWSGFHINSQKQNPNAIIYDLSYRAKRRWLTTDLLVIDEVSMLSRELFEKLDAVGKLLRNNDKLWGGIQLVFSGDFFQLPPVCKNEKNYDDIYCFKSPLWVKKTIYLSNIVRQNDPLWVRVLNNIRIGNVNDEVMTTLESRIFDDPQYGEIEPTKLYSKIADVNRINQVNLHQCGNPISKFFANKSIRPNNSKNVSILERWTNECSCEDTLELAVGAQVVLTFNMDADNMLINGSRGIVVKFDETTKNPWVKFANDTVEIHMHSWTQADKELNITMEICQYPLKLAWALTIHKCQGMSLDCALIDLKSIFEYGQAYVALSRVRTLDGLYIVALDKSKIKSNPVVRQFYSDSKNSVS